MVSGHSSSTYEYHKCDWLILKTGVAFRTSSETKQGTGCLVNVWGEAAFWQGLPGTHFQDALGKG